jgi:predicted phosphodiesterase
MENECDVVIFGHIHKQVDTFEFGIRFLNPGAMRNKSYMILTVDDNDEISVEFKG